MNSPEPLDQRAGTRQMEYLAPKNHSEQQQRVKDAVAKGDSAFLCVDGWAGRCEQPVMVLGITGKKSARIKALKRVALAGNRRWLDAGEVATVPAYALKFKTREVP